MLEGFAVFPALLFLAALASFLLLANLMHTMTAALARVAPDER